MERRRGSGLRRSPLRSVRAEPAGGTLLIGHQGGEVAAEPAPPRILLSTRYIATTLVAASLVAVAVAIPTDIIDTPWFTRMIPMTSVQWFFWIATSLTVGALLATYALGTAGKPSTRTGLTAGILGYLAVGCPICNKLVIALLGVSGALTYFGPIQPILGVGALLLAGVGLALRIRALRATACSAGGLRVAD